MKASTARERRLWKTRPSWWCALFYQILREVEFRVREARGTGVRALEITKSAGDSFANAPGRNGAGVSNADGSHYRAVIEGRAQDEFWGMLPAQSTKELRGNKASELRNIGGCSARVRKRGGIGRILARGDGRLGCACASEQDQGGHGDRETHIEPSSV